MKKEYKTSTTLKRGQEYTFSVETSLPNAEVDVYIGLDYFIGRTVGQKITFEISRVVTSRDLIVDTGSGGDIIERVKLEKGSKATDWTPAPEDDREYIDSQIIIASDEISSAISSATDEKISSVTQTIEGVETRINDKVAGVQSNLTVTARNIRSEVNSVDERVSSTNQTVSSLTSTVSGKASKSSVTQLENRLTTKIDGKVGSSEISQLENKINLKVSKGSVISEINVSREVIDLSANTVTFGNVGSFTVNNGVLYSSYYDYDVYKTLYTTMKATGDVAFATASPKPGSTTGARLQIWHDGTLRFGNEFSAQTGRISSEGTDLLIQSNNTIQLGADVKPSKGNSYSFGNAGYRWKGIYVGSDGVSQTSDARLKKTIHDIPTELLNEIAKEVKPKVYWVGDRWSFGYIAQDVERALFKYVTKTHGIEKANEIVRRFNILGKSESYLALVYSELAVLKDTQKEIRLDELERRVEELTNEQTK